MLKRETIIRELWSRFAAVEGVVYTARNPKDPPSIDNLPCIQFFELGDIVTKSSKRGASQPPIYNRKLTIAAETFLAGTNEQSASYELTNMMGEIKKKLYVDGNSLGNLCEINEVEAGRVLRPPIGGATIGIGLAFEITYVEDTKELFL